DVIGGELDRDRQPQVALAEVRDADLLEAFAVPQQRAAKDVEVAARSDEPIAVEEIDVRKIDREDRRVVRDAGIQQERPEPADRELEARQKARVPAVQAVPDVPVRVHIAEPVEHREGLALLQYALAVVDTRRGGVDVVLVVDEYELTRRAHLWSCSWPRPRSLDRTARHTRAPYALPRTASRTPRGNGADRVPRRARPLRPPALRSARRAR